MSTVYLARCPDYKAEIIQECVRTAAKALGITWPQRQRVFLKPNCVWAHPKYAPSAYTHPEVLRAVARLLHDNEIILGEHGLIGFPTNLSFSKAGYTELAKKEGFRLLPIDEAVTQPISFSRGVIHTEIRLPREFVTADFRVALPKLKTSVYTGFTAAVKLNLGLLQSEEMGFQHYKLADKLVDLLELPHPDLIIVDAIHVGEGGSSLTCRPRPVGALIIGTDPLAVDVVCAQAFGLNPGEVEYLRLAAERGYGSIDPASIEIIGDLSLTELMEAGAIIDRPDVDLGNVKLPPHVRVVKGEPYYPTGTAGALRELFYILEQSNVALKGARETTLVIGRVDEELIGQTDTSALVLLGNSAHVSRYRGFGRVVRLKGTSLSTRELLDNLPFIMKIENPRDEFLGELGLASVRSVFGRLQRRIGA